MSSFFEKLKRGMGADELAKEEPEEEKPEEEKPEEEKLPEKKKRVRKSKTKPLLQTERPEESAVQEGPRKLGIKSEEGQSKEISVKEKKIQPPAEKEEEQFDDGPAGQLAIDLFQTETELVIQSAIAGIKPENLDVAIERDVVTIKGVRRKPEEPGEKNYFYQECYWGPFYREIILPEEVDPTKIEAEMREGILTIRIPKIQRQMKRKVMIKW